MVSFSCERCGDILTKKKLDPHRNRCRGATFTCIDCMVHFLGTEYRTHTACMSEEQKYQGNLYKKNKRAKTASSAPTEPEAAPAPAAAPAPPAAEPKSKMPQKAYVEEVSDDEYDYEDYEDNSDDDEGRSPAEPLPEAPTPPPVPENVNVFDFLVAGNTPNASNVNLAGHAEQVQESEETQLVRYDYDANAYLGPEGFPMDADDLVQYGTGPIPATAFETPAPKVPRKKTKETSEVKTDKKRKRLHVETDQVMTDAPPVLHSGLTGGLNRLMKPMFLPSPDHSGGDVEPSPASPLKKTKHSKHKSSRHDSGIGNNLLAMIASGSKSKTKKRKVSSKKQSSRHHKSDNEKAPKMIEYRPGSSGEKDAGDSSQMVVYRPRADLFLSMVNKGPESERGCSVNKALKRFHRERSDSGASRGKVTEEKELWRSLRMRRNERGEIVLFCI